MSSNISRITHIFLFEYAFWKFCNQDNQCLPILCEPYFVGNSFKYARYCFSNMCQQFDSSNRFLLLLLLLLFYLLHWEQNLQ